MKRKITHLLLFMLLIGVSTVYAQGIDKSLLETLPHLVAKPGTTAMTEEQKDSLKTAIASGQVENFLAQEEGVPAAVDMGLSVYWATFNVGANNPFEIGEYYAWAETQPKETYNSRLYKYGIRHYDKKTKYCFHEEDGIVDKKGILDLEDDAAHVNWGKGWRTPSKEAHTVCLSKFPPFLILFCNIEFRRFPCQRYKRVRPQGRFFQSAKHPPR